MKIIRVMEQETSEKSEIIEAEEAEQVKKEKEVQAQSVVCDSMKL